MVHHRVENRLDHDVRRPNRLRSPLRSQRFHHRTRTAAPFANRAGQLPGRWIHLGPFLDDEPHTIVRAHQLWIGLPMVGYRRFCRRDSEFPIEFGSRNSSRIIHQQNMSRVPGREAFQNQAVDHSQRLAGMNYHARLDRPVSSLECSLGMHPSTGLGGGGLDDVLPELADPRMIVPQTLGERPLREQPLVLVSQSIRDALLPVMSNRPGCDDFVAYATVVMHPELYEFAYTAASKVRTVGKKNVQYPAMIVHTRDNQPVRFTITVYPNGDLRMPFNVYPSFTLIYRIEGPRAKVSRNVLARYGNLDRLAQFRCNLVGLLPLLNYRIVARTERRLDLGCMFLREQPPFHNRPRIGLRGAYTSIRLSAGDRPTLVAGNDIQFTAVDYRFPAVGLPGPVAGRRIAAGGRLCSVVEDRNRVRRVGRSLAP